MVDSNLALVLGAIVLLVGLVSAGWGTALWAVLRAWTAAVDLVQRKLDEALALAEHRRELLEQAAEHLADAEAGGREAVARRAALDDALRAAPPGGKLDAVERVLREQAAARRARRAAEAGAAAAGAPAGPGPDLGPGAPGVDGAHA